LQSTIYACYWQFKRGKVIATENYVGKPTIYACYWQFERGEGHCNRQFMPVIGNLKGGRSLRPTITLANRQFMPVIGNLKGGKVIAIDNLCMLLAI
jgi:hypothetical protein